MPNEEMSLQLYTDGESGRPALTYLSTRLEAVLSDQKAEWCARAPEWYLDLVASLLHRFGCDRTPVQSDLYRNPAF